VLRTAAWHRQGLVAHIVAILLCVQAYCAITVLLLLLLLKLLLQLLLSQLILCNSAATVAARCWQLSMTVIKSSSMDAWIQFSQ
jgi:glucan phosphoethanolaminetransferase (alkaline phosphatase superfamily)